MSNDRLLQVLLSPRVTEKTTLVGEKSNQYVFHVVPDAKKSEVKGAVELLFEVSVKSVRMINVKGKPSLLSSAPVSAAIGKRLMFAFRKVK